MGTGEPVTVMACGQYNLDGYAFSVYHGAYCDGMECVEGRYEINVEDAGKCTFGAKVLFTVQKSTFPFSPNGNVGEKVQPSTKLQCMDEL